MKRFSYIAAAFIFAAISAVSGFAQGATGAASPQSAPFKMAVIDSEAFAAQTGGIIRYAAALKALSDEFRPMQTELQGMVTKYNTLGTEIKSLQEKAASGTVPIDQRAAQAKVEEAQNLELAIKRKQEDMKARAERREPQVMGPIRAEIGKALNEYTKQRGYALILDASKLDGAGLILGFDETKIDATKDFITYFNARPATTASTATPR